MLSYHEIDHLLHTLVKTRNVNLAYKLWHNYGGPREVLHLMMSKLREQGQVGQISKWLLLLVDKLDGIQPKSADHVQRDAILAIECLESDDDYGYFLRRTAQDFREVVDILGGTAVELLHDKRQISHTPDRLRAALFLNTIGDPRIPVTIQQWQEELSAALNGDFTGYFCLVERGNYSIGSRDEDLDAYDSEKPRHDFMVRRNFLIARYPITNSQILEWANNLKSEQNLNNPGFHFMVNFAQTKSGNQPVVYSRLSFSIAYCDWLSQETNVRFRLPLESEWEAAARGVEARLYPWGHIWIPNCAATKEDEDIRGLNEHMPVGCYPAGAATCGAMDMAGNVWEQTTDFWKSYLNAKVDFFEPYHVQRGGSYKDGRRNVRCTTRIGSSPEHALGFRVVVELPAEATHT